MTLLEWLVLLGIAGLCGAIGRTLAGGVRSGCLVAVGLGFIGALIGRWLADALELPAVFVITIDGAPFPVVWSILGSALFVAALSLVTRRR